MARSTISVDLDVLSRWFAYKGLDDFHLGKEIEVDWEIKIGKSIIRGFVIASSIFVLPGKLGLILLEPSQWVISLSPELFGWPKNFC